METFEPRKAAFDIDEVIEQYKDVISPANEEELVAVLLRQVKVMCEEQKVQKYRVVEIIKDAGTFRFRLQGRINKEWKDFGVDVADNRPKVPFSHYNYLHYQNYKMPEEQISVMKSLVR